MSWHFFSQVIFTCVEKNRDFQFVLLPDDLDQHPLSSPPVEFAVEDLFPRPEIKPAASDGRHHLPAHDLPFQMGIAVVLPRAVVEVPGNRFMGGQRFQPLFIILMEARLIVVDEDGRRNMHRINEDEAFSDPALCEAVFHLGGDVDQGSAGRHLKPQLFSVRLHGCSFPGVC